MTTNLARSRFGVLTSVDDAQQAKHATEGLVWNAGTEWDHRRYCEFEMRRIKVGEVLSDEGGKGDVP